MVATASGVAVVTAIADVVDREFAVVGIDMPMGLPNGELRRCEPEARRYLSPRGSTIFPTPARACLAADDYVHACALSFAVAGKKISKQSWAIMSKIAEVDRAITVQDSERVIEVHPECAFLTMNDGRALPSKHTSEGLGIRAVLIRREFGPIETRLRGAKPDDVLDAYAALWSARRFHRGVHMVMPTGEPQFDERGLPMRIII